MAVSLQSVLELTVPGLGYELVDVELANNGLVRIFIDKQGGITVEDCATVSSHLQRLFEVENIGYERLEVSSPGLDRALKTPADFERFAGEMVRAKLRLPLPDKRKRLLGKLVGFEDGHVIIDVDGERVSLEMAQIDKVRLEPQF